VQIDPMARVACVETGAVWLDVVEGAAEHASSSDPRGPAPWPVPYGATRSPFSCANITAAATSAEDSA
jgi:hypothetical protein